MQAGVAFIDSVDIPQTSGLDAIRKVVDACAGGAITPERIHRVTGVSVRHVGYALQSARILGWVERDGLSWCDTATGRALLAAAEGSDDELDCFRQAISGSAQVKALAPKLIDPDPPDRDALVQRILDRTDLSPATARRRVQTLIAWRKQAARGAAAPAATAPAAATQALPDERPQLRGLQIEGYGPVKSLELRLRPLTAIAGGAGSGKSTALDAIWFVAEALSSDLYGALASRHAHMEGLGHGGRRAGFAFALEFTVGGECLRYEVEFGRLVSGGVGVRWERLFQRPIGKQPASLKTARLPRGWRCLIQRDAGEPAQYHEPGATARSSSLEIEPATLALARLPRERAPGAELLRRLIASQISRVELETGALTRPCSALVPMPGRVDGSAFPRRVRDLQRQDPDAFIAWSEAAREILPELAFVRVAGREDRLELTLGTRTGLQLPAARLSGSTLRVLALLLVGFTPGLHLVEHPEACLPPDVARQVLQAWAGGKSQILFTTASEELASRARHTVTLRRESGGIVAG